MIWITLVESKSGSPSMLCMFSVFVALVHVARSDRICMPIILPPPWQLHIEDGINHESKRSEFNIHPALYPHSKTQKPNPPSLSLQHQHSLFVSDVSAHLRRHPLRLRRRTTNQRRRNNPILTPIEVANN